MRVCASGFTPIMDVPTAGWKASLSAKAALVFQRTDGGSRGMLLRGGPPKQDRYMTATEGTRHHAMWGFHCAAISAEWRWCRGVRAAQMGALYEPNGAAEAARRPPPFGVTRPRSDLCRCRYSAPTHAPYKKAVVGCIGVDHIRNEPDISLALRVTGLPLRGLGGVAGQASTSLPRGQPAPEGAGWPATQVPYMTV